MMSDHCNVDAKVRFKPAKSLDSFIKKAKITLEAICIKKSLAHGSLAGDRKD